MLLKLVAEVSFGMDNGYISIALLASPQILHFRKTRKTYINVGAKLRNLPKRPKKVPKIHRRASLMHI